VFVLIVLPLGDFRHVNQFNVGSIWSKLDPKFTQVQNKLGDKLGEIILLVQVWTQMSLVQSV
jgi:hypothetical protein